MNKFSAFSPADLSALLATGAPAAVLGAGAGALIPSTDAEGKTHRLRNAAIGAGAGELAGLGLNGTGQGLSGQIKSIAHPGVMEMLVGKTNAFQRALGRSPSLWELIAGVK